MMPQTDPPDAATEENMESYILVLLTLLRLRT